MIKQIFVSLVTTCTILFSNLTFSEEITYYDQAPYETQVSCCPRLPVGILFDKNLSPFMGASVFKTLLRGYQALDETWLPDTQGDKNAYMMLGRFGKCVLEGVLFSTAMVAQHEYFGHGARAREFDLSARYRITPWSGYTKYSASKYNQLSPSEQIAFLAGGMEGTGILAKRLRDQFLDCNMLDQRAGHLYWINMLDQPLYVLRTKKERSSSTENDVTAYIQKINTWNGQTVLTKQKLRRRIVFDFIDPFFFFSLYSAGHYIYDGSQCWEFPMIPIGDYRYLPGFRTALAPYGPETQFINYIKGTDQTIQATFRYGKTGTRRSAGASAEVSRLWCSDLFNIDGRLDLWHQPKLFVASAQQASRQFGGSLSATARYRLFDSVELFGELGYKSKGYVPGYCLKQSPILRIGFNADL